MSAHPSVYQAIAARAAAQPEKPATKALEGDRYVPTSYADLIRRIRAIGTGLLEIGLRRGDRVGLIADNRPEWILADLAATGSGAIDVPRGADTPASELEY